MYARILVAYDGSTSSARALQEALRLTGDQHAAIRAVHVLDEAALYRYPAPGIDMTPVLDAWRQSGREILQQAVAAAEQQSVTAETELLESGGRLVADVLLGAATAWSADLVVIGTHGRHGVQHLLLGSVAEGVIRRATVPVLVVHSS